MGEDRWVNHDDVYSGQGPYLPGGKARLPVQYAGEGLGKNEFPGEDRLLAALEPLTATIWLEGVHPPSPEGLSLTSVSFLTPLLHSPPPQHVYTLTGGLAPPELLTHPLQVGGHLAGHLAAGWQRAA